MRSREKGSLPVFMVNDVVRPILDVQKRRVA